MWRKGLVLRLPEPKDDRTRSRWMYVWKPQQPQPKPAVAEAVEQVQNLPINKLLTRPNIEITEEGDSVVITLPSFTITVKKN